MRRPLYYDARSRRAEAAAALVRDLFEVAALAESASPSPSAVVLVDAAFPDRGPIEGARIVALVDAGSSGPWPAHWYALVPAGATAPIVTRAVENAFGDLAAGAEITRLGRELAELNAIGIRLSAERDPQALLELILTKAREITESDAGSLYVAEEAPDGNRRLAFVLAHNDTVDIPFRSATLPITNESVAGYVALTGRILNLEDAYAPPPGSTFRINRSFDERAGYRTKSMLVVPMRTPKGETIGVLQLINSKPGVTGSLGSVEEIERRVRPYSSRHEMLVGSLASQAAVTVENARLYENIRRLFEGFVTASVTAIESRDPTTSGHSFRVAELTVGLAEVVDRWDIGRHRFIRFTPDEMQELRYAALLHDFGKVGVREHVLLKAKKLYPAELERIRHRIAFVKRGIELRFTREKLAHLLQDGKARYPAHEAALDRDMAQVLAELDEHLDRIVLVNEPTVLPQDVVQHVQRLALQSFADHLGEREPLLTPEEAEVLAIEQGSLTRDERREIQSHVVHTYQFLMQIPWTKEFRRIPDVAGSHHEMLDGTGYPHGLAGDAIPVQSRIMAIADIYDALTAADRPYKKAVPLDTALDILIAERKAGHIDAELLELFIAAKVYERTRAL
ncbi:MAG: GAF domain-containing protein [Candidatus Rokubacteria bacterium]|nr:GAF domain-containing protein [Candidatus Rokubacteria bacterium]